MHISETVGQIFSIRSSETAGWIYTVQSVMELSKPIAVQHYGLMVLTLDFHGQILKKPHQTNRKATLHGTKGM